MHEEEEDLDALYRSSYSQLVGQVAAFAGSVTMAEEAVQEAFVQLIPRWSTARRPESPRAWLRRVALNRVIDESRRAKRRRHLTEVLRASGPPPVRHDSYPSTSPIARALADLDPAYREILLLKAADDLSVRQIAHELNIAEGTVKSRLSRARAALRTQLDQEGHHAH